MVLFSVKNCRCWRSARNVDFLHAVTMPGMDINNRFQQRVRKGDVVVEDGWMERMEGRTIGRVDIMNASFLTTDNVRLQIVVQIMKGCTFLEKAVRVITVETADVPLYHRERLRVKCRFDENR